MALTDFQRGICRLVAEQRKEAGVSYVAGGVALNLLLGSGRVSRDIDVFHDAEAAVHVSFAADRRLLELHGYTIETVRELPGFIEAVIRKSRDEVRMEWARDSAFRFFPLMEHEELGLTLHPFDLASNKVLALVGRLEVRDWVDAISSQERLQPLGYLLWAACGKDPGFGPGSLLEHARRTTHYSAPEIAQLAFEGSRPDARALAVTWRTALDQAAAIIDRLPYEQAGTCVLDASARLFRGDPPALERALAEDGIRFHEGSLGGAYPRLLN
ncbi:MAG: hypothetical protein OXC31_30200 [Spirochaetaceae bacterium]|nr:hypothetical protein [Spirochaetaceae bacterium]